MPSTFDIVAGSINVNLAPKTKLEEILQNLQTIISTVRGSVPLDRAFGIDPDIVDRPILEAQARITDEILRAVREYEPRARINNVGFAGNPDGRLIPKINVTITTGTGG